MASEGLKDRAQNLLAAVLREKPDGYHASTLDTAIVASLEKSLDDASSEHGGARGKTLLFPEAFTWLLSRQQAHGGWDAGVETSQLDCILNAMAGLLAMVKCKRNTAPGSTPSLRSLDARIRKAQEYLDEQLQLWDPESDSHRLSIQLVAKLVPLLRAENMQLPFLKTELLDRVSVRVLSRKVDAADLDADKIHTVMYSTRACLGGIELEELESDKSQYGITHSPAATALHMLQTSVYDEDYMVYLQRAMKAAGGSGVPAVFPQSLVEKSLAFEVIIESGLIDETIDPSIHEVPNKVGETLISSTSGGTEASELATKLLLHLLPGAKGSQEAPILEKALLRSLEEHRGDNSLDMQCTILKALLRCSAEETASEAVVTLYERICNSWWTGEWNLTLCHSELFGIMLFAQLFNQLSPTFDSPAWDQEATRIRSPITITQMLARILSAQNANGAWGANSRICLESTAFALLALSVMIRQPFLKPLFLDIQYSIAKGREVLRQSFLSPKPLSNANALWLGQTTHRSNQLCEAHVLAALSQTSVTDVDTDCLKDRSLQKILALSSFFHSNPNLSNEPLFKIKAGAVESTFYVQKLKAIRHDIFPATNAKEKDKYFDYIPIMWTMHNNIRNAGAPPVLIWDICVVSLYIFLVDEYMEGHVSQLSFEGLSELRTGIENMFALDDFWPAKLHAAGHTPDTHPLLTVSPPSSPSATSSPRTHEALGILSRWASRYMTYPSLLQASSMDLLNVRTEAKTYLLCHVQQISDNKRLSAQPNFSPSTPFGSPSTGYASWLHCIGGGHIGAALALTWFAACVGSKIRGAGQDCFRSAKQKLMLWNANSHSAKQLRMFNDYGSVIRDFEERNLNSTSFPEFFGACDRDWMGAWGLGGEGMAGGVGGDGLHGLDQDFGVMQRKQVLLDAALYERHRTNEELDGLYAELRKEGAKGVKLVEWLGLYLSGGDQFSDMYLLRDVTNSTK